MIFKIMKKYAMFIGRWQTWHNGHQWLIDQQLKKGKNVCIAIRDVEPDSNNPWNAHQTKQSLEYKFRNKEQIKVIIIPDIESINYGRDVGYEVIEHLPPEEIKKISGTKLRRDESKQ